MGKHSKIQQGNAIRAAHLEILDEEPPAKLELRVLTGYHGAMDAIAETPSPGIGSAASVPLPAHKALCVAGNYLTLFVESAPMIASMVRDIDAAQKRVWLEVYTFNHDSAGQAIAAALRRRAAAGLDVRLLYDTVGSQYTPASFLMIWPSPASKCMPTTRCGPVYRAAIPSKFSIAATIASCW